MSQGVGSNQTSLFTNVKIIIYKNPISNHEIMLEEKIGGDYFHLAMFIELFFILTFNKVQIWNAALDPQ